MSVTTRWIVSLAAIGVFIAVGVVEAARTGAVGLVGVLCVAELLVIGMLASIRRNAPVGLRGDLRRWLESVAAITGEPPSHVADRAVSSFRAASVDERDD